MENLLNFLLQNLGTIIVLAVLVLVIAFIIIYRVKAKKNGKNSCGCGCKNCASYGVCHSKEKDSSK